MKLNKRKTKIMACSKVHKKRLNINIKNQPIEQVQSYCYLGSKIIDDDGKSKLDIKNRIAQGKRAFQNKKHLLTINSGGGGEYKKFFFENICMECYTIWMRDLDGKHN